MIEMSIHRQPRSDGCESGMPYFHVYDLDVALKIALKLSSSGNTKHLLLQAFLQLYQCPWFSKQQSPLWRSWPILPHLSRQAPIPTEITIPGKIQLVQPGKKIHPTKCCSCSKGIVFCPSQEEYSRYSEMHFNDLHIMWNKSLYSPAFLLAQSSPLLTRSLQLLL